jgi:hypothetical protein
LKSRAARFTRRVRAKALDERLHHARGLGIVDAVKIAREAMTNSAAMAALS